MKIAVIRLTWLIKELKETKNGRTILVDDLINRYARVYNEELPTYPPSLKTKIDVIEYALPNYKLDITEDGKKCLKPRTSGHSSDRSTGASYRGNSLTNQSTMTVAERNKLKEQLVSLDDYIDCGICKKIVCEPVCLSFCQHLFCYDCVRDAAEESDEENSRRHRSKSRSARNALRVKCDVCNKLSQVETLDPDGHDHKAKLGALIIWYLHRECPVRCTRCGYIETVHNHAKLHRKCTPIKWQTKKRSAPNELHINALDNVVAAIRYFSNLLFLHQLKIVHTRVCARIIVSKSFDPVKDIANERENDRFLKVDEYQTVDLIAHPGNTIYGYSFVKLKRCFVPKWIPTACLLPRNETKQEFIETLNDLRWQEPGETSRKPIPLIGSMIH